ncbi:unnamed protein product [Paramecium primaurelia]|uniref:Uncharacterized protein n=1 Tax=Paramecium primaurelia TaxID=5886 RepID=A0A8S1PNT9_PARPR|nr:unnamed protein product [Paramecium primaurelia]
MLKNDIFLEALTMVLICLITLIVGNLLNHGTKNSAREQQHVRWKSEKNQFSVVLTDSEFNTLLDETNYID